MHRERNAGGRDEGSYQEHLSSGFACPMLREPFRRERGRVRAEAMAMAMMDENGEEGEVEIIVVYQWQASEGEEGVTEYSVTPLTIHES